MGQIVGFTMKESLFCCPGVLYDMYEIYLRANNLKKHDDDFD